MSTTAQLALVTVGTLLLIAWGVLRAAYLEEKHKQEKNKRNEETN